MFRGGFYEVTKLFPNHATVSTEDLVHSNFYTVEKFVPFSYTKLNIFQNSKKNFTSANQSTNQVPHLGIFYSRRVIFIDAGLQRGTSFNRKFDMKMTIF
jgi:hypothetical protein